ncbi:Lipoamide acyltransferase component of branched-chain alpha-keto acid dehydrogenase complex, mitochondrial [Morella rubra]|uniref:Dihydrolipoamide acetyltransferase component of pyruvate dehydrogenase complex n=1 Tax=Morella rubra TaxID=262757 RepID=A0A6A1VPT6_9ROSI|nr:Lipoamide acyltransferase component of branched-chain alpha-keto acid dehydrogenase complex, mitochondrial [Morella rubra]
MVGSVHLSVSVPGFSCLGAQSSISTVLLRSDCVLYVRFGVVSFNCPHSLKIFCFSSHALADLPLGGIVDVPLAQTGEGIAECELLKWFVQEGDQIEEFQPICEVQSDKATIEITSRYKGRVAQILYVPGDIVKVGETLLQIVVEEAQVPTLTAVVSDNPSPTDDGFEKAVSLGSDPRKNSIGGVLSTPAVRHLAKQHGVDINDVLGTGKDGRILKEDVLKYAVQKEIVKDPSTSLTAGVEKQFLEGEEDQPSVSSVVGHDYEYEDKTVPLRGFQRAMVKSMSMAAKVPHFHYVDEINCDALMELKASFQDNNSDPDVKHTFLPLLIKSLSMALSKYPSMNSCFNESSLEVVLKGSHNIGIAMATPYGLVVPNIKNVQSLSILEITKELSRLQKMALGNKLDPVDIFGGTITLSNIGAIGGKFGSPLLNLPEVSIIAIGRIQKVPQFGDDGNLYPASIMTVNIGADHRVLDGATVARFCNEWKQFVEKPELLMLHMK